MVRAFRSELIKLTRWSVLAGGAAMIVVAAFFTYEHASQVLTLTVYRNFRVKG